MRTAARRDSFTYATFNFNKLSPRLGRANKHNIQVQTLAEYKCLCVVLSRLTIANTVNSGGRERLVSCSVIGIRTYSTYIYTQVMYSNI